LVVFARDVDPGEEPQELLRLRVQVGVWTIVDVAEKRHHHHRVIFVELDFLLAGFLIFMSAAAQVYR